MNKRLWAGVVAVIVCAAMLFWVTAGKKPAPVAISGQSSSEQPVPSPTLVAPAPVAPVVNTPATRAVEKAIVAAPAQGQPQPDKPTEARFLLCEHIISSATQYEFSGEIRLINKGQKTVNGWSVSWEYEDGSTIIDTDDVALSGSNPYTGEYLSWNAEIPPGETVTFRFTGLKGTANPPLGVRVRGRSCM